MAATAPQNRFSVSGKTAIVTGAGSGINLAFAALLLSRNCNVLFADLGLRPEAQELVEAHRRKRDGKGRGYFLPTDVADWKQLDRMFAVAYDEFGGIDIVCPGAGVYEPAWSNFWRPPGASPQSKDDPDGGRYALLDVNITHPIRTTQLAIAEFLNPVKGSKASPSHPKRIVHVSSIAGQLATISNPMYVASKWAISGFTRALGKLDEVGIRVNGVAPGVIKTPLWTDHPEKLQYFDENVDEWATAEEVAEAMLKLLEDPNMIGGTILEVGHKQTRVVQMLNDPGPSGAGHTVSNVHGAESDVWEQLGQANWGKRARTVKL